MTAITAQCCLQVNIKTNASPLWAGFRYLWRIFTMEEKNGNALYCSHCGALIGEDDDVLVVNTGSGLKDIRSAMTAAGQAPVIAPTMDALEAFLKE